ncbi:MAG: hypothetical protein D6786_04185 [Gammaproteobacteria bacterium]|nr:MAG: hypothetical protein D6786_04185 [Gammaproteobacteria bacterium]
MVRHITEAGRQGQTRFPLLLILILVSFPGAPAASGAGTEGTGLNEALARAQAALEPCRRYRCLWRDSEAILERARAAAAAGESEEALRLARRAARQGELAENQYWLERAKRCLERRGIDWAATTRGPAVTAIREYRGAQAYRLACGEGRGADAPVSP